MYKLWSSSFCNFLQPPVTSSLLGPNILLSILFSNTLNPYLGSNVRYQVSHPACCTEGINCFVYMITVAGSVMQRARNMNKTIMGKDRNHAKMTVIDEICC
jgi:hypothetical protein